MLIATAKALVKTKDPRGAKALFDALKGEHLVARAAAAEALKLVKDPHAFLDALISERTRAKDSS